jgi:predicted nucleic acid-binding protein
LTLHLDSSALFARYLAGDEGATAGAAMALDDQWCACAIARPEVFALIERLDIDDAAALRRRFEADWERLAVVPVDHACLDRAGELLATHPLRLVDAIHLAAALRLPRPVTYVTFDHHQIPVALALGFEVVST